MVDIIDVVLAKALSPQGQIDTYAARAQKAVSDANRAIDAVENAGDTIDAALQATEELQAAAQIALDNAAQAQQDVEAALANIGEMTGDIDDEIDKLALTLTSVSTANAIAKNVSVGYPSGKIDTLQEVVKYYTSTGNNTDGTMTQKAITEALQNIDIPAEINLGEENEGRIVVIDEEGKPVASAIKEEDLFAALIKSGNYELEGVIGLQIDYENKTAVRVQEAVGLNWDRGLPFNKYSMYGGRMRCIVADDGTISAFNDERDYIDDGSNGQVMVYQPKFYYQRLILKSDTATIGQNIRKEMLLLSSEYKPGFKLHPLFIAPDGEELEYVLMPAYEGSVYDSSAGAYDLNDSITIDFNNDKLSSISGAKPVTGVRNNLNIIAAEQLANNRGEGWHITNMAFESANQMLEMVEFGTMNGQSILGKGISNIQSSSLYNCASITGSTGAISGPAESTINEINGTRTTYTEDGYVAISYRGLENPWGNTWRFIGGCNIKGDGNTESGIPFISSDFQYDTNSTTNYVSVGFCLPALSGWISAMGYGNKDYDWVYMPSECINGNDAAPVGDNLWTTRNLNGINIAAAGGSWSFGTNNGPFYYGCDRGAGYYSNSYNPRLMFIPTKNSTYYSNIEKWVAYNKKKEEEEISA